jgi:hypothetical protein
VGYDVDYEGVIRLDPPLSRREQKALNRFADTRHHAADDVNELIPELPGYWCTWTATKRGHLQPPAYPDRSGMLAEWLVWLRDHLIGAAVHSQLDGIGAERVVQGTVLGEGRAPGDQFRIVANAAGVFVERDRMPCPACWLNCKAMVPPSAAYAFTHPEAEGNIDPHTLNRDMHEELLARYETRCFSVDFRPVEQRIPASWPMPPDSPPPLPPFQLKFAALMAASDLPQPEFQARIRLPD